MPERGPFLGREQIKELSFLKAADQKEPFAKLLSNLSFIAGAPYFGIFALATIRVLGENPVPAYEFLSGSVPWVIYKFYERIYNNYTQLPDAKKVKIVKKVSSLPISKPMEIVSKILDFPITKRRITYRMTIPRNINPKNN